MFTDSTASYLFRVPLKTQKRPSETERSLNLLNQITAEGSEAADTEVPADTEAVRAAGVPDTEAVQAADTEAVRAAGTVAAQAADTEAVQAAGTEADRAADTEVPADTEAADTEPDRTGSWDYMHSYLPWVWEQVREA